MWIKTKCIKGEVLLELNIPSSAALKMMKEKRIVEGEVINCKDPEDRDIKCPYMMGDGCLIDTYFDGNRFL